MLYILRKTESIPRQSEARFLTAAARARACALKRQGFISNRSSLISREGLLREPRGSGVPGVCGGCCRLGSAAVSRGPYHRGLTAAPASQFSFLSPFSLSPSNSLEQLCSVLKKHFLSFAQCFRSCPGVGGGVSLPGFRLQDLLQRGKQVPRDPSSWGYPCFVLGPQRWTLGRLEPRPRVLPSED